MNKTFTNSLAALACATMLAATPAFAQITAETLSTLDVSASVDIKAVPDVAVLSAGVTTQADTAEAAMRENATKMTAVRESLKKAGIADKDIQTSGLNLNAQYSYKDQEAPKLVAYRAENTVTVTLHNLDKTGEIIDVMTAAGTNRLNGPHFSIKDPDPLLDKARADAVKKAADRAKIYADAAGMKIKRVIALRESGGGMPPQPFPVMRAMSASADAMMEKSPTPISIGEVGLSASVSITYELAP